ncbi:uroporphyrinogen-III C-methyltransferase [Parabacteroides sp. Marseille-P3160]|uniref:uroporphyrinogen-III C-methyltransferase n=1 Tax=Parabacteroides sp. Marseille-P3160 TaxID=1917887 RepID=UPI0009BAF503|nr:uroporphyrinogen-III C-methyltransferase [Parabacteroides sp. Marseille-P3160]
MNQQIDRISPLRVISRKSKLSLLQVKEAFSFFPNLDYQLEAIESYGDKHKHISLMSRISPDFFTRELDLAVIGGRADVAVHSAKDLPYPLPAELELVALLEAFDKTDALVSRDSIPLLQLPAGSRIGTSSATRKAEVLKLRPDLTIIAIRGTIEERIAQVDNGSIDSLIVATCALKRLHLTDRITEILPFKTHPLQGNLAVIARKGSPVAPYFQQKDIRRKYGKVILVGFGPGNPDLLTIAGDKALAAADIIFYDDLLDKEALHKYKGEKIYVGKRKDVHSRSQDEINELLYGAAVSGKQTVRLKGGDPMIFAHGREEIDYLKSRFVEVEVIPGISSGIALAAYTQIPLTHRGVASSVAFVTGHSAAKLQTPDADTLVYYMGGANVASIARRLIAEGWKDTTPVALVHKVSLPEQKTFFSNLKELTHSVFTYPTPLLVIVGEVVSFENRQPQNVLVTSTSKGEYESQPNVVHTPLIQIEKIHPNEPLRAVLDRLDSIDWIIFTSRYGVSCFMEELKEYAVDIRSLSHVKFASVGPVTTQALASYYLYPAVESTSESAEGLLSYFEQEKLTAQRILLPRSKIGLKQLSGKLTQMGNQVYDIPVYTNTVNRKAEIKDLSSFQKIVFSSPSGIDAFTRLYGKLPEGIQFIVKGKTTEQSLIKHIK